jgi:hypothetical protein
MAKRIKRPDTNNEPGNPIPDTNDEYNHAHLTVKITHPVRFGNRIIHPGETTTVKTDQASLWIQRGWAAAVAAEVHRP